MTLLTPLHRDELFTRVQKVADSMLNEFLVVLDDNSPFRTDKTGYPRIDVQEYNDKFILEATVPGLTKEDVKIEVAIEDDTKYLSICSEGQKKTEASGPSFIRKEIHKSSFRRNLALPTNVDDTKIQAAVKEGILTVTLPKRNPTPDGGKRKIDIT